MCARACVCDRVPPPQHRAFLRPARGRASPPRARASTPDARATGAPSPCPSRKAAARATSSPTTTSAAAATCASAPQGARASEPCWIRELTGGRACLRTCERA
eukprot:3143887-Pleurochrysis_carterae.AAC.1